MDYPSDLGSLQPRSCGFLPVHHCLDRLGTRSWEPGSSSLAPLGGWDWSWVFVSSPETIWKAAKRWDSHSAAFQEKKHIHWHSTGCPGAGTSALLQWDCLHNTYRSKPGERHLWGPEEVFSSQALRSTVLQPSQSKAQETSEVQGSWAILAGHFSSLGLKALSEDLKYVEASGYCIIIIVTGFWWWSVGIRKDSLFFFTPFPNI